jgi:hypothetical protein
MQHKSRARPLAPEVKQSTHNFLKVNRRCAQAHAPDGLNSSVTCISTIDHPQRVEKHPRGHACPKIPQVAHATTALHRWKLADAKHRQIQRHEVFNNAVFICPFTWHEVWLLGSAKVASRQLSGCMSVGNTTAGQGSERSCKGVATGRETGVERAVFAHTGSVPLYVWSAVRARLSGGGRRGGEGRVDGLGCDDLFCEVALERPAAPKVKALRPAIGMPVQHQSALWRGQATAPGAPGKRVRQQHLHSGAGACMQHMHTYVARRRACGASLATAACWLACMQHFSSVLVATWWQGCIAPHSRADPQWHRPQACGAASWRMT